MGVVFNNAERVINIGGIQINPGSSAEVSDEDMDKPRVKELLESGDLSRDKPTGGQQSQGQGGRPDVPPGQANRPEGQPPPPGQANRPTTPPGQSGISGETKPIQEPQPTPHRK